MVVAAHAWGLHHRVRRTKPEVNVASDAKWVAAGFDMAADLAEKRHHYTDAIQFRNCALELRRTGRCPSWGVYMAGPKPEAQAQPDKAQGA